MDVPRQEVKFLIMVFQLALIIVLAASSYLVTVIGPRERGFFCGDETIRYPYFDNSIPMPVLYITFYVTCIFTILLIETLCSRYLYPKYPSRLPTKYYCDTFTVPATLVRFLRFFLISQLGFAICIFVLNVTKYSVGRLRPHFLDVCKPSINTTTVESCGGAGTFVFQYLCYGKDKSKIEDARLSFYSGHTSHCFYWAVFLSLYIHARYGRSRPSSVVMPVIYTLLVTAAAFVGYSRIFDFKHHVSDVLFGGFMGTLIAVLVHLLFRTLFYDLLFDGAMQCPPGRPPQIKTQLARISSLSTASYVPATTVPPAPGSSSPGASASESSSDEVGVDVGTKPVSKCDSETQTTRRVPPLPTPPPPAHPVTAHFATAQLQPPAVASVKPPPVTARMPAYLQHAAHVALPFDRPRIVNAESNV